MIRDPTPYLTLRVLQQNTRKSLTAQMDLLNMTSTDEVDVCIIQEPYINFLHLTSATPHWSVIYPTRHTTHPSDTRVITLISEKMSSDGVQQIDIDSSDLVAISVTTKTGTLDIYNIYLDCNHSRAILPLIETISNRNQTTTTLRP